MRVTDHRIPITDCHSRGNPVARQLVILVSLCLLAAPCAAAESGGSPFPVPDYSGHVFDRPALTGDWWGRRTTLANQGVTVDIDVMQVYQNIVDGDREGGEYGGSLDYNLYLDFQKMGLWPGAFVNVYGETQFGESVIGRSSILATNTDALLPLPNQSISTLTALTFFQFFSEQFGVFFGKLQTFDGDANAFASGRGKTQFLHQNFVVNPVLLMTVPYSGLGAGIIVLPTKTSIFNVAVIDKEGNPEKWSFDTVFKDATTVVGELRVGIHPFDLPGHQLVGGSWTDKDSIKLDGRILVPGDRNLRRSKDQWAVYYNFDQFVYVDRDDEKQGVGLFGRFGAGDPDTNPIEWFASVGIGGKGLLPGRAGDSYGIGYYFTGLNSDLGNRRILNRDISQLEDGHGFELFYNIEVVPWLHLTPDLQVVEPGLKRRDTAVIVGGRCLIDL
jgi:porin